MSQIPDVNRELAKVGALSAVFDAIFRTRSHWDQAELRAPRGSIFWKPLIWIEQGDLIRPPFGPFPKDQVHVVGTSPMSEAADQHPDVTFGDEAIRKLLGPGHLALEHLLVPRRTVELVPGDPLAFHRFRIPGIEDVLAIDPILAKRHGMKRCPERAGFAHGYEHIERGVESGKTSPIEASAVQPSTCS